MLEVPGSRSLAVRDIAGGRYSLGRPGGEPDEGLREELVEAFSIGEHEVRVRDFVSFLNATDVDYPETEQVKSRGTKYRARRGLSDVPIVYVDYTLAEAYVAWLGKVTGHIVRLPSPEQWEVAARGGLHGARYASGWVRSAVARDVHRVGRGGPPNGYGIFDMEGNVFEWCRVPSSASSAVACGGSFAERDAMMFEVSRRVPLDRAYRGRDVGLRVLVQGQGISN